MNPVDVNENTYIDFDKNYNKVLNLKLLIMWEYQNKI